MEGSVVCILLSLEHAIGPEYPRQAVPEPGGLPGRTLPMPRAHVQRDTLPCLFPQLPCLLPRDNVPLWGGGTGAKAKANAHICYSFLLPASA